MTVDEVMHSVTEICRRYHVQEALLFGSRAKGTATDRSDFDLAWKVMKDIIIQYYEVVDFPKGSPREVLKKAFEFQLIDDDVWLEMLRKRNDFTHDYDGALVKEACGRIVGTYIDKFYEFSEVVEKFL